MKIKSIENIWYDARKIGPENDGSEILCIDKDGHARINSGELFSGTIKWAFVSELEKSYKVEL